MTLAGINRWFNQGLNLGGLMGDKLLSVTGGKTQDTCQSRNLVNQGQPREHLLHGPGYISHCITAMKQKMQNNVNGS